MEDKNIIYLGVTGCQAIIDKIKNLMSAEQTAREQADSDLNDAISDLNDAINQLDTDLTGLINALNSEGKTSGAVVTNVTQEAGQISVEAADLTSSDKSVVVSGLDVKVNVDGKTLVVDEPTGKISVHESATAVSGEKAIVVTDENGKKVTLLIKSGDKILAQDENGLSSTLDLVKETEGLENNVREQYKLVGIGGAQIGATIKVYKDSSLKDVNFKNQKLEFTYILVDGTEKTESVDVSAFLSEEEFADGLVVTDHIVKVKIDSTSESFLTVGPDGVKLAGVQAAINTAKSEVVGTATSDYDTLGKLEGKVKELESVKHVEITAEDVAAMFAGTYGQ